MKNKAYLETKSRQVVEVLWQDKINETGYFATAPVENIFVAECVGRITAVSTYAKRSVPHYNSAAMDGIAVKAHDTFTAGDRTPKILTLLPIQEALQPDCCYMINTGNSLPPGTDAVIMIEHVHLSDGKAEIMASATPWQHVRMIGEDIVEHELILPEYELVTPAAIAAMLSAGIENISVVAKPKVSVIPTGSELVVSSEELVPGKILDVNSAMLGAAVTQCGGVAKRRAIAQDSYEIIKAAIVEALTDSDMVIVNAGTSAGTEDYTYQVLADLGEVIVHGVAIKPGKPVVLAICQDKPVIGLPGYPVSAMLAFDLFVKPILFRRAKTNLPPAAIVSCQLARQLASEVGVEEYIRVSLGNVNGRIVAVPLGRGAGVISSLMRAQGVIKVGEGSAGLAAGSKVEVSLLNNHDKQATRLLCIGSHDLSLDILGLYLRREGNIALSCANVGSAGGVMAIRNGEAQLAGVHILDEVTGTYNVTYVSKYLAGHSWQLVHLAQREQGLMVQKGNPCNIFSIADLTRSDIIMVNRQRGAGTRMLLDYELKQKKISYQSICGYEKEVGTHMAVAATIAAGAAQVGLGIRAAADIMGLDFIPVAEEQYDIIVALDKDGESFATLITILKTEKFRKDVEALGGYNLARAGEIIAVCSDDI